MLAPCLWETTRGARFLDDRIPRLGKRILALRRNRHLTQQRLAEAAGIKQHTLSRFETGGAAPSLETLFAVADALNVRPAELLESEGERDAEDVARALLDGLPRDSEVLRDRLQRVVLELLAPE